MVKIPRSNEVLHTWLHTLQVLIPLLPLQVMPLLHQSSGSIHDLDILSFLAEKKVDAQMDNM
jgi:hypothetical protein